VPPIRGDIKHRPKHEGPLRDPGVRQNERPPPWPSVAGTALPPMLNESFVVENIDIEGPRPPRTATSPSRFALDSLQQLEQGFRRQGRLDQHGSVDVRRLTGSTHRRRLVKARDRVDRDTGALDFAYRARNALDGSAPRSGTISAKAYQRFAIRPQLRIAFVIPMLSVMFSSACLLYVATIFEC